MAMNDEEPSRWLPTATDSDETRGAGDPSLIGP
jgi:hypothetical protein